MVESIHPSGLASYIQSIKTVTAAPAGQAAVDPTGSTKAAPTRSVQVSISEEAISSRQSSD